MFDNNQILTAFRGQVGWRQNHDSNGVQLITSGGLDLANSTSSFYFNDEHPTLDFANLVSISPDFKHTNTDQTGINQDFSDWLKEQTDAGIIRALTDWYNKKLKSKTGASILEKNNSLDDRTGTATNKDINSGHRVFREFKVKESGSIVVQGLQIGFQFSDTENFTVRLYEQGKQEAIASTTIYYTTPLELMWFDFEAFKLEGGKTYYLSYDQSDITSQSLNGLIQNDYYGAGRTKFAASNYFDITAGYTTEAGSSLWDTAIHHYNEVTNYGMNLKYKVRCDYTNFLIENKEDFTQLISIWVATMMVHRIAFNPQARSNRNVNNVPIELMIREIDGESQGRPTGLVHRYTEAMNALQFDLSTIDPVCLKCKKKARLKTRVG